MRSVKELLVHLDRIDVKIWIEGTRLRYSAPKGALSPDLRAELTNRREEILAVLMELDALSPLLSEPIKPTPRTGKLPLSFAQERMWFLHQLMPNSIHYNLLRVLSLEDPLDLKALEQSLNEVVQRHEILRTYFEIIEGHPIQRIHSKLILKLDVEDLRGLEPDEREQRAMELARQEYLEPFDLNKGPLLRAKLLRLSADHHWLLLAIHHIVIDGWSMGILIHELSTLYSAIVQACQSPLPELPIQYADFAMWQREWLRGKVLEHQLGYWKRKLEGYSTLHLPIDRSRPVHQSYEGGHETVTLSESLTTSLNELSLREGATLFMTLLSAFYVLLYRYSGQEDILVGSPIANRNRVEIEELIGFFANTLPLRGDLSGDPSFRTLLRRVREIALEAYEHQDLPFEKLVEEIRPHRDLSRNPLFQVAFALQNTPTEEDGFFGLSARTIEVQSNTAKFDLLLFMEKQGGRMIGTLEYATDLYTAKTARRMLGHFNNILQGIVEDPDRPISKLPLLSQPERRELLEVLNQTHTDYPYQSSIHELFEAQVKRSPEAVAVVSDDQQLSYSQLNQRANQLAHYLRTIGVKRGSLVPVFLERSIDMVVCMLGILKVGGAYVPLDVNTPTQRISLILQDTGADVLLTREGLRDRFTADSIKVVDLVRIRGKLDNQPCSDLELEIGADDLAYVIYTSGSTGIPKGVEVPHQGVVCLVCGTNYIQLTPADRVAHISNCSFDASTFEVWGALLSGARLVVLDYETVLSPRVLSDRLQAHGINLLLLTTALFNLLANEAPKILASIDHLLFGGETSDAEWVRRVLDEGGAGRLLHMYGPTEATTFTTWYEVFSVPQTAITIPIGRPLSNTKVYVLDHHMNLVPIGVPGELYIGGDGIARGYLNRPELTAERFPDAAFLGEAGSHLFRTGDIVRWLPNGVLEFLGRQDNQVKLRGFRIELGEIEFALNQHPRVRDTVVHLRHVDSGKKQLVAFVVSEPGEQPTVQELRLHLQSILPRYMIPSLFVILDKFPFTTSGKIDQQALSELQLDFSELESTYSAPQDSLERQLVAIWEKVLDVHPIGVQDDFFDLGGHSLLGVELISAVRKATGVELSVATLFHASTIESQAVIIRQQGQQSSWSSLVPIQEGSLQPPLYCIHWAGGNVLSYRDLAHRLGPDQTVYGLQAVGSDGKSKPHTRIEDMASFYVDEICAHQPSGPYYLAGASMGGNIAFEIARRLMDMGKDVALVALFDTIPMRWQQPLPIRERIEIHSKHMRDLSVMGKFGYLFERACARLFSFEAFLRTGLPLPSFVRDLNKTTRFAIYNYQPGFYRGKVTLFMAAQREPGDRSLPFLGWDRFVGGGIDVVEVSGTHGTLLSEPYVKAVAEELQKRLNQARSRTTTIKD
jgi:amino acid adenylation domain-containing protein